MTNEERLALASAAYRAKAEGRQYVVSWRGGGEAQIYSGLTGFDDLTTLLNISGGTLSNYLCRGGGAFQTKRINPITEETDICTITRVDPPAKQKRPRGRPRTRFPTKEEHTYDNDGYKRQPEFFPRKLARRKPNT